MEKHKEGIANESTTNEPGTASPDSASHSPFSIPHSPFRLAFCITELDIGGAERAFCELAVRIDKTRFSVTVYSLRARPEDDRKSCVPMLEAAGIPVRFLDMKGKRSFFSGLRKLRRFLEEQKPDLFLSFLFHANFLGRLAASRAGVPHIVSGIRVAERQAGWHLALDRWTSRRVEKYVCVSRSVADFSKTVARLPEEKLVVIPNGVEIPSQNLSVEKENRILFIGRLHRQKGLDWLLNTTPDWLAKLPDWKLAIAGDGPERETLVERLSPSRFDAFRDRIEFLGWREDTRELLAMSKFLVLPSRWEGMPNVVLQAMACGLPVVATRAEGIEEILGPLSDVQTCDFGDDRQLVDRILRLAENSDFAAKLGEENRRRVEDCFSIDSVVHRYEEFFTGLLAADR